MKKRGQVTLFIIIGFIILILFSFLIYIYQSQHVKPEIIAPEFLPIKNFVEECTTSAAADALTILGAQGGYIELPPEIKNDPTSYLSFGNGILKGPYWYYHAQNRMPYLSREEGSPSIQEQLESYISENLQTCLSGLSNFREQFDIQLSKQVDTEVSIGEDSVNIYVNYPINIKSAIEKKVGYISKFHSEIPIKLKQAYTVASKILASENDKMFLENMTIDLMALSSDIPFSEMTFDCNKRFWYLARIQKEVQRILSSSVPFIRIYHTSYAPFIEQPATYEEFRKFTPEDFFNGHYPDKLPPEDAYEYFNFFGILGFLRLTSLPD
jgi:hypothetical protein